MNGTVHQLLRDLRGQKLRTLLTILGIVWGTVAITLLLAFAGGLQRQIAKDYAGLGDRIVIGWTGPTTVAFGGLPKARRIDLTEEDVQAVERQTTGLQAIAGEFTGKVRLRRGAHSLVVDASGVPPVFGDLRNLIPAPGGRFINERDVRERRRVAFIGNQLAEDVFGGRPPIGDTVLLNGYPFVIVGVLQKKVERLSLYGQDKDMVFIPASTFRALTGERRLSYFVIQAASLGETPALVESVRRTLGERLRFDPHDKGALSTWDMTKEVFSLLDSFFLSFNVFLAVAGSLTMVVGGIGVSNIMHVVVEERTREIGIKMALGARHRRILRQFLLETMLITATGGALGFAISIGVCALFPALHLTDYVGTPSVSPGVAALTTVLLGAVGLVAGYFPARHAARLDPVAAMKL